MPFTLQEANLHSPDAINNRIVRQIDQMDDSQQLVTNDLFPLVELSDTVEKNYTQDGLRFGMRETALASESPVGDIEGLGSQEVSVRTFKKKISPNKGADTELNSQQEILNLFNASADALMEDILMTRARMAWQGTANVDGMLGTDGATAHPEIPTSNIATPATPYSDTATSTPIDDMMDADFRLQDNGNMTGSVGQPTMAVSPSVLRHLKLNDDIQSEFDNVRALSETQLSDSFQGINIRVIRTKLPRLNAAGEPVDETGAVVDDPTNAARDNVLEPWDPAAGVNRRNILIGMFGQGSAIMPWFLDRLAEMGAQAPSGDVSVDATNGWMTQSWTNNDPLVSWFKVAQEIGFHVVRGGNFYVIQDI